MLYQIYYFSIKISYDGAKLCEQEAENKDFPINKS
jgi:hypothetical protein